MDNYSTEENEENEDNFLLSSFALYTETPDKLTPTFDFNQAKNIVYLDRLAHLIIKSEGELFYIDNNQKRNIKCKKDIILKYIKDLAECFWLIPEAFPIHEFNPYVETLLRNYIDIFKRIHINLDIHYPDESAKKIVNGFNELIERVRKTVESSKFKADLREHQKSITKNHNSLLAYIDNLFKRHGRLLVLRVDLTYGKDFDTPWLSKEETYQKYLGAKKDREHFFNNMRSNKLFDNMLGYAWKLEFASRKGWHYHMFFFFDGSKVREDVSTAKRIGEYWEKITGERGIYYNCNAHKEKYDYLGIGMINHHDTELMENLKHKAAPYLTKTDYYAKIYATDIGRAFGRAAMKAKVTNRGRRRKNANTE